MISRRRLKWGLPLLMIVAGGALYAVWPHWTADPQAQVDRLVELLELPPGATAGEVGAGKGRMTLLLARRLGAAGRVFSTELDSGDLDDLKQTVTDAGVQNVTVIRGGEQDTQLPAECCDAIFMRRVYHHFTHSQNLNASLIKALRPGGRLAVIDFAPQPWMFWLWRPKGVPDNRGGHGIPPAVLIEELTRAGFVFERRIDNWPGRDYCLVFREPARSAADAAR